MLDLSSAGLKGWFEKLPKDVSEAIRDEFPTDSDELATLSASLGNATGEDLIELVKTNPDLIAAMGRPARIRVLAHVAKKVFPDHATLFHDMLNKDDEESGGKSKTQILFLEDIRAFNDAIAARVYQSSMDATALEALRAAAFETEPTPAMGLE